VAVGACCPGAPAVHVPPAVVSLVGCLIEEEGRGREEKGRERKCGKWGGRGRVEGRGEGEGNRGRRRARGVAGGGLGGGASLVAKHGVCAGGVLEQQRIRWRSARLGRRLSLPPGGQTLGAGRELRGRHHFFPSRISERVSLLRECTPRCISAKRRGSPLEKRQIQAAGLAASASMLPGQCQGGGTGAKEAFAAMCRKNR